MRLLARSCSIFLARDKDGIVVDPINFKVLIIGLDSRTYKMLESFWGWPGIINLLQKYKSLSVMTSAKQASRSLKCS